MILEDEDSSVDEREERRSIVGSQSRANSPIETASTGSGRPVNLGPEGDWPREVATEIGMDEELEEEFVDLTVRNLADPHPRSDDGLPNLAEQFWTDIQRDFRVTLVHSATDAAPLTSGGKPQAELKRFVGGSDRAAYHLSKFLSQTPLNTMMGSIAVSFRDEEGRRLLPMFDPERTQALTVTRGVDKTGQTVIDMSFAIKGGLNGLAVDGHALEPQPGSRFSGRMRLQIPLADLENGKVDAFRIVEPPSLQLRASVNQGGDG